MKNRMWIQLSVFRDGCQSDFAGWPDTSARGKEDGREENKLKSHWGLCY